MNSALKSLLLATTTVTVMASTSAIAYEAGDILVKGGAATVAPNEDSGTVTVTGGEVKVDDNTQLGLTFTYMYTDKIGFELLAATPFEHDIEGTKALEGLDIASIKHLPPTLTLNYYFADSNSKIQPYIGAGINYTIFFDEDADSALEGVAGSTDVELDNSWGLAFHAGIDYQFNDQWALNAGYWYLDIDTEAKLKTTGLGTLEVDVDIDPNVYMIGLSYKF